MKCVRLLHVNLRVDRLDAALRFYGEALGLPAVERDPSERRGAWFSLGAGQLHVTEDATPQPPSRRHFAIEVDDLAEARRRVVAAGRPIEQEEPGRFWTRDPAGNRIEIVACASAR